MKSTYIFHLFPFFTTHWTCDQQFKGHPRIRTIVCDRLMDNLSDLHLINSTFPVHFRPPFISIQPFIIIAIICQHFNDCNHVSYALVGLSPSSILDFSHFHNIYYGRFLLAVPNVRGSVRSFLEVILLIWFGDNALDCRKYLCLGWQLP